MKTVLVAAIIALTATMAYSQGMGGMGGGGMGGGGMGGGMGKGRHGQGQSKGDQPKRHVERETRSPLADLPDKKFDPWFNMRPGEPANGAKPAN